MQQQKRTWLSPLEIVASMLCLLYGAGFFLLARVLDEMGLIALIVRQTQGIGIGMFLIALLGFLRLRTLSLWLHVLLGVAWLGLIAIGYQIDQVMGNDGLGWFTPWAIGIAVSLSCLHLFLARQLQSKARE